MWIFLIIIGLLVGPILFLPWREMWIWTNGLCLLFGWFALTLPDLSHNRTSFVDAFVTLIFIGIVALAVAALLVRIVIFCIKYRDQALTIPAFNWPWPLTICNGFGTSFIVFMLCFYQFSGGPNTVSLHFTLIGMGIAAALISIMLWHAFPGGIAIGLIALTLYSALYPGKVHRAAHEAAQGAPYCIYLSKRQRFSESARDLTFLTFDKSTWRAHAILIIKAPDGPRYGNWSYRQGKFMVPWDLWTPLPTLQCPH